MNLIINDISNNSTPSINSKDNNCQELKNIAYKTMLINGTDINPKHDKHNNTSKITKFLEVECNENKQETWSKLDRTQRIMRLNAYADTLQKRDDLSDTNLENLKKYFIKCLDRKSLIKSKEVTYSKDKNVIENIPHLIFNEELKSYILRKDDKHVSTIKSLPLDKKSKTKTIKIL